MVPSQFQQTRPEHEEFDHDIFWQRIYQEERYQKYWNWLDDKRTGKQRVHKEQQEKKKEKESEKKRKAEEKQRKKEADTKRKADEKKQKARESKRMRVHK